DCFQGGGWLEYSDRHRTRVLFPRSSGAETDVCRLGRLREDTRMSGPQHVVAIDQGTTSTRAMVFDASARATAIERRALTQHYGDAGRVEHDPEEIWRDTETTVREVIARCPGGAAGVAALGITNQRETVVVWERVSGAPIHPAIVWQDRRTAQEC